MKKKKFAKLREWNRRRNYLMKALRMNVARLRFDLKERKRFDFSTVKRVIFLRDDDKIGDMVVSTSLFREFGRAGYEIDVLAGKNNASIIEHNPYIHQIIIAPEGHDAGLALAKKLARQPYDLVVDMGDKMSPSRLQFLRLLNAGSMIGFNKPQYNIYTRSLDYPGYDTHITGRYALLLESLGFKEFSTDYDLHCPVETRQQVGDFIASLPGTLNIVLNPFTADKRRDLSLAQCSDLVTRLQEKLPTANVIIIGSPSRISSLSIPGAHLNPFDSLSSAIELIRRADLVISPDTSIVHIATAWKKPLVCLYGHDLHGKFINSAVWGPGNTRSVQLFTRDKEHPVSTIAVEEMITAVEKLL
ncbi:glycosyltransferase family 9 protein [Erwinia sp. JUb26]|uniref:glycosyltransferase family 9 protein n=1 Tax=Erwinia sp. JUb26 TaxID=2485126 RepID=UPI000F473085|nr:glycosyltransferase family 9 protein [Erwinia sp. JUb26]ROR04877.1 ADP-heptose:LPS heptosyltransferase [Erwinia sp. JUb26]